VIGVVFGLLILVCAVTPWTFLALRRLPAPAAVALAVVLVFALPLVTLLFSGIAKTSIDGTVIATSLTVCVVGLTLLARSPRVDSRSITRAKLAMALPSLLGATVWLGVLVIAQLRSGSQVVGWAMNGDSANNILFAREVIYRGGIGIGAGENPVPLTSAVMGLAMSFGRGDIPSSELLRHDVAAFALLWELLIALTCVLAGVLAVVIARQCGSNRVIAAVSGGIASVLPLSWLISGYPMQFGFFNTHVALPVVLAAVLAFLRWRAAPVAALSLLMLTATLLLAVWSPLVLLPAGLGLVIAIGGWRSVLAVRGSRAVLLTLSGAQLAAYGVFAVLPALIATGDTLGAQGGAITFPTLMLPIAAVTATFLAFAATRSLRSTLVMGTAALAITSLAGLAILLVIASRWTYYPSKFAWLAGVVLALLMPGMILPAVSRLTHRIVPIVATGVLLAVASVALIPLAPTLTDGQRRLDPLSWIVANNDALAEQIFTLADLEKPRVLWESGDPNEGVINFWLLQIAANSLDRNFQLRVYAYDAFQMTGVESLCQILKVMPDGVEVLTANPALEGELTSNCPARVVSVTVR